MPPKKKHGKKKARREAEQQRRREERMERKRHNKRRAAAQWGGEEWKREWGDFEMQLRSIGLRIKDMTGDGNCMFRSIADQMEGRPDSHMKYRQQIVDHMVANDDFFAAFCDEDDPFPLHIAQMRKNRTWGGHLELQAASQALAVNICIHQLSEPRWEIINWPESSKKIHLSYHNGDHYSSVRSIKESDRGESTAAIEIRTPRGEKSTSFSGEGSSGFVMGSSSEPNDMERVVMEAAECADLDLVREHLFENCGDMNAAIYSVLCMMEDTERTPAGFCAQKTAWVPSHKDTCDSPDYSEAGGDEVDECDASESGRSRGRRDAPTRETKGRGKGRNAGHKSKEPQTPEERLLELRGRLGKLSNKERKEYNRLCKTVTLPTDGPREPSSDEIPDEAHVPDLGTLCI